MRSGSVSVSSGLPIFRRAHFKNNDRPVSDLVAELIYAGLAGELNEPTPEERQLEEYRERCRQGDPFPLIAMQWPELLITDPAEAIWFEGEIGNPDNPCLRLGVWQRNDVILPFFNPEFHTVAIKGNTKAGKGASVSLCINLWYDVFPAKIILTSTSFDHAKDVIFGEFVKWRLRMRFPVPGSLTTAGLSTSKQHYVTVSNPKSGEGFSGQHGDYTLFVFDEASSSDDGRYDDATKQARKIVALANPRTLYGWFRDLYRGCTDINKTQTVDGLFGRIRCITVGGSDCLNVRAKRLERPIAPIGGITINDRSFQQFERIPPEYYQHVKPLIPEQCDYARFQGILQHPDKRHVAIFGHGHFPEEDPEKQVILGSWLERHEQAWSPQIPVEAFALDVARSQDGDSTCFAAGGIQGVRALHAWKWADTMFHAHEAIRIAKHEYGIDLQRGQNPICVDMDGLGSGTGDRLREMGVWVIEFRGNASSQVDSRIYGNLRAEAYGTLGRRLSPEDKWGAEPWALPPGDTMLRQDLTAPEKIYGADPLRWHLLPKYKPHDSPLQVPSIKEKLGRSPDRGDTVAYLWHAVRELHMLNALFAPYRGDLVTYPLAPEPQPEAMTRQQKIEATAEQNNDLLGWLTARYGEAETADPWADFGTQ